MGKRIIIGAAGPTVYPRPDAAPTYDRYGCQNSMAIETRCATCDGPAYAIGGGSLWCLRCLKPFVDAGKGFQPSITVRRQAVTA